MAKRLPRTLSHLSGLRHKIQVRGATASGLKAIRAYVGRSEATVLDWSRSQDFPARKISGVWERDTALVDVWRRKQIESAA